jgi:hypothetical protein
MPPLLAHGALGWFDEILFIGVGLGFIAMMALSWLRSRNLPASDADPIAQHDPAAPDSHEHFRLD